MLRGEAGSDVFTYYANADIAGDTIDGGSDAGGSRDQLQVGFTGLADFTGATIASTGTTSIERLSLFGAGHDVRFNRSQVGGTGLAANLAIQGDDAGADIVTFADAGTLDLSGFTFTAWSEAADRIIVYAGGAPGALTGTSVADSIVGNGATNMLNGNGGADFLFGDGFNPDGSMMQGPGNDMLAGGGEDTLTGGAGTDFLFGGAFSLAGARLANSGADTLRGGDGNDGLYGFDGADIINGDDGNDYIESGGGDDIANGGAGSDFVLGEAGNDTPNGGAGFDYLYGAAGADTFDFYKGDSADWILDFSAAQGDKLRFLEFGYANFAAIPLVDLSTPGNPAVQLTFIEGANVDQLTIFGVTLAQLNATNVLVA